MAGPDDMQGETTPITYAPQGSCMYVYACVCMCMYVYVCVYKGKQLRLHMHARILYVCVCMCVHVYIQGESSAYISYSRLLLQTRIYVCACMYAFVSMGRNKNHYTCFVMLIKKKECRYLYACTIECMHLCVCE
jgi:hypothetical protein